MKRFRGASDPRRDVIVVTVAGLVASVVLVPCAVKSCDAQELAALTPGMATETFVPDLRLEPRPLLIAQKSSTKKSAPKKGKQKKSDKPQTQAKESGNNAAATDSFSTSATSASPSSADTNKKDACPDDAVKPVPQLPAISKSFPEQFAGNASWYGVPFHGRKTASGEIFDMYKCSAAHKTLPLVTRVLVEDPRTGNTVLVRVNDRGPFVKTRVMDLSREAARKLGTLNRGVYYIEATVLGK